MAKFLQEFKAFAMRGNVLDMAVGVIIGAAFGKIVTSLVNDLIMPCVGVLTGGIDFTSLFVALDGGQYATLAEAQEAGAAVLTYGSFIQNIVDFLLIAICIFVMIKGISRFNRKSEPAPAPAPDPEPSAEEKLLAEIRDLLKSGR